MDHPESLEVTPASGVPSARVQWSLLLVPVAFNALHALLMVAVYRQQSDLHLQIWLLASGLTLLVQLAVLFGFRRNGVRRRSPEVDRRDSQRLRAADFVTVLIALLLCVMQASFLGYALSSPAFGPQRVVGFPSTSGNWQRLLWAWYALGATPLVYLQALALTPYKAVRLLQRGGLRTTRTRWLLGSCLVLALTTLVLSELVVYFL